MRRITGMMGDGDQNDRKQHGKGFKLSNSPGCSAGSDRDGIRGIGLPIVTVAASRRNIIIIIMLLCVVVVRRGP
jgi:hypothetical protein